jgi:hypothetical protein
MRNYDERTSNRRSYDDDRAQPPRGGQRYGNGHGNHDREERPRYQDRREASRRSEEENGDAPEWTPAHEVRVKHISVTIWQREGRSGRDGRPLYSLTLTRTFQSSERGGYLTTNKLFASDAPLAAEAFRLAAEWLEQGAPADDIPF